MVDVARRVKEIRQFLSPEFKVFRSNVAVVEYMLTMGGYSDVGDLEADSFLILISVLPTIVDSSKMSGNMLDVVAEQLVEVGVSMKLYVVEANKQADDGEGVEKFL